MTASGSGTPRTARPRSGCNAALAGCLALLLCATLIVGGASAAWSDGIGRPFLAPWVSLAEGLGQIAHDSVVSHPRIAAVALAGPLPICPEAGTTSRRQLAAALALMRGTPEGNRLFGELVANGVCIRVAHLPYNSAYTRAVYSLIAGWSGTRIVVDDDVVASGESDVLAALLVHEATHVDRAIDGLSCAYTDACVRLSNGVELDEEIAAHAAEARWWIAVYGRGGKRFAFGADSGENALAHAYEQSPAAFAAYVRRLRSDPREGSGL